MRPTLRHSLLSAFTLLLTGCLSSTEGVRDSNSSAKPDSSIDQNANPSAKICKDISFDLATYYVLKKGVLDNMDDPLSDFGPGYGSTALFLYGSNWAPNPADVFLAQSFTPDKNMEIQKSAMSSFFYREYGGTSEMKITADYNGVPGTVLAQTSNFVRFGADKDCKWTLSEFEFSNTVSLVKNIKYWMVLHATNAAATAYQNTGWGGTAADTSGEQALRSSDGQNWTTPCYRIPASAASGPPYILSPGCSVRFGLYRK